jgi:hypothetical protein
MPLSKIDSDSLSAPLTVPAGSAAAPAITTTGDTNTGIFFPAADTIAFSEGGAEVARFDSSGNLAVGTTATTYNYQTKNIALYDASSAGISIVGGAKILTLTAQSSGGIFVGSRSNDNLIFATNDTERARITSGGKFCIGNTGTGNGVALQVDGSTAPDALCSFKDTRTDSYSGAAMFYFQRTSGTVGSITTTTSATAYVTSSDYRLKEFIIPMTGALTKVSALKPVTYKWKLDGSDSQGFIAHELQAIVPECVVGEKDAVDADGNPQYQGIDTSFLVATLTAAIQELKAIVDAQGAEIAALKGTP